MSVLHFWLAVIVVGTNGLAAGWLGFTALRGQIASPRATTLLQTGRLVLLLQIGLGILLTMQGYVGAGGHYLAALAALGVLWWSWSGERRGKHDARVRVITALVLTLLVLLALVLGVRHGR